MKKRQRNKDGTTSYLLECMVNGRRYSKTVKVFTYAEAKKANNKFVIDCEKGLDLPCNDTIDTMLDTVMDMKFRPVLKRNTLRGYETIIRRIKKYIGSMKVKKITSFGIQKMVNDLDCSPKTIKNTYSLLAECFSAYVQWKLITESPCNGIKLPRQTKKKVQIMNINDLKAFIVALDNCVPDMKVALMLAVFCGLRKGEICGLDEEDFDGQKITINKTRYYDKEGSWVDTPKSSDSHRTLYLPSVVVKAIGDLFTYHKKLRLMQGSLWTGSAALIKKDTGEPIRPDYIYEYLQKFLKRNGLKKVSLHALRHTYASFLKYKGKSLEEISSSLGHSEKSTTLNIYIDLFDEFDNISKTTADDVDDFVQKMS